MVAISVISIGPGISEEKAIREITASPPYPTIVSQTSAVHQSIGASHFGVFDLLRRCQHYELSGPGALLTQEAGMALELRRCRG